MDHRCVDEPGDLRGLCRNPARAHPRAGRCRHPRQAQPACHKSEKAKAILKERGTWFLFLPPYSPDLNPIEMAFSKLKAHLLRIKARTIHDLWRAVGNICDLYTPEECWD